ncbi:MAG: hypothetical protein ACOX8H_09940 [Ruminococcus sp.]
MKNEMIKDTYQQIGRELREWGAEKVILLSSRTDAESGCTKLEIVTEGIYRKSEVQKQLEEKWPKLRIRLLCMEDMTGAEQIAEIENDGIKL